MSHDRKCMEGAVAVAERSFERLEKASIGVVNSPFAHLAALRFMIAAAVAVGPVPTPSIRRSGPDPGIRISPVRIFGKGAGDRRGRAPGRRRPSRRCAPPPPGPTCASPSRPALPGR